MNGVRMTAPRTGRRLAWYGCAALVAALAGSGSMAGQAGAGAIGQAAHHMGDAPGECNDPALRCASSATPTFAPDGALWLAWAAGGQVSVARSSDHGRTFSPAAFVTPRPLTLDGGADERPQLLVLLGGRVIVAYAIFKDARYNGQIFTAVSKDAGATFSAPQPITDDGSSQRFINLTLDTDGQVFASWIDKRRAVSAQRAGQGFDGASLAFAWSTDGGEHFGDARIAHDHMCECCRLGVALTGPHQPAVVFRNIFDGERDHALLQFNADLTARPITRVAEDHWKLDACPHHGPSLTRAADGSLHAVWFSGGGVRQGSFYAHSTDGGASFSEPMRIGEAERAPTRPYVLSLGGRLYLTWKEFDGEETTVRLSTSVDGGRSWAAPRTLSTTTDYSDHPLLISDGRTVFVSWMTKANGYRLLSTESAS